MGFFGRSVYSNGCWSDAANGDVYLSIDIHDSDIATVTFGPTTSAQGIFYLGFQPRDYFEDPAASGPIDLEAEATAFITWATHSLGRAIAVDDIRPLLAEAAVDEPEDDFVELTVERLLNLLDLPIPPDFPASS